MKKKTQTRPTTIPKAVRPFVVKKFRTKDKTKRFLVLRMPDDAGFEIRCITHRQNTSVRMFTVDTKNTELPIPVQHSVLFNMAVWCTRLLVKGTMPSPKLERSRRRRFTKKAFAEWQAHQATKSVVLQLKDRRIKPKAPEKLKVLVPYICLYDPNLALGDTTFRFHTAICDRLDKERAKVVRSRGGASWVVSAKSMREAVALQLAEFVEGDMGYDASDFTIHSCGGH